MLFTKGAGSGGGGGGSSANKVVAGGGVGGGGNGKEENKDGGKESGGGGSGGIVIYNGDDDGGVGECDDEDLRLLESMGGGDAKNKAPEGDQKPATAETKGRIHTDMKLSKSWPAVSTYFGRTTL